MSIVWSYGSNEISRGPSSRGRSYPVNPTSSRTGAFSIGSTQQAAQLAAAKSFLSIFLRDSDGDAHLVEPVMVSSLGGPARVIQNVRVGAVFDVQRRRRNRVAENYVAGAFP
jgi:hypothetical protein